MAKIWIVFEDQEIEIESENAAEYRRIQGSIKSKHTIEKRREKRTREEAEEGMIPYPTFIAVAPDPFDVLMEKELKARIDEAVNKLPPRQREVFELVYYEQSSFTEAAKRMKIARQNVSKLAQRALKNLRNFLDAENATNLRSIRNAINY